MTHETYLRLDQSITSNQPDNARALAFKIALNLAIDYQRKVNVRKRYGSEIEFDTALEISSNQSAQPDITLIGQEKLARMNKALDKLPVKNRTAFYLHSVQGLTYSEIA